ncbi:MAG: GTPase ObgE [Candidatus Aminicenantes bacterium]|nr:GTPase ObgE [Candidatus Aminicenantes bacterium]
MFVDRVEIIVRAGKGGNGCVSFRREAKVPRGGPDGGRGGDGGSVILAADPSCRSLSYFRFHPINKAKPGSHGEGANKSGKRGDDLTLIVPVGTVLRAKGANEVLCDLARPGDRFTAARGGKGGRGNASFATATHQAPREHEPGRPGEERELVLELKLIADVGLVGFPNAGKSTLLSKVSAARPVIADYPFTTLVPNLGVVDAGNDRSFILADIPGLIERAHLGHGLGIRFLRHIERTKVLVHVVDISPFTGRDPVEDVRVVNDELEAYNPALLSRPQIIAANKTDLLDEGRERLAALRSFARAGGLPFHAISALKGDGLSRLVAAIAKRLAALDEAGG